MRAELDQLLCQRYPQIFAERHRPADESGMGSGFECGDGWFDLIDALCERLQFATDHNEAPQVLAAQVKEKWGQLRFHLRETASPEQRGMIRMAEAMSARLCEQCGKPGQTLTTRRRWVLTRCAEHAPAGAMTMEAHLARRKAQPSRPPVWMLEAQLDPEREAKRVSKLSAFIAEREARQASSE